MLSPTVLVNRTPIPLRSSTVDAQAGSPVDIFKFKVLLSQERHHLLTRFCYQEFSESTIFLFDAIQDFKTEEDEAFRKQILSLAYEEYMSANSKRNVCETMEPKLSEAVGKMIALVSTGYYSFSEIEPTLILLEEYLIGSLMQTYERFTQRRIDHRSSLPKIRITTNPPPLRAWGSMHNLTPTTPLARAKRKTWGKAKSKWFSLMRMFRMRLFARHQQL